LPTLSRVPKSAPDIRDPLYTTDSDYTLMSVAVNSHSVFIQEEKFQGDQQLTMVDKLTLASTSLPFVDGGLGLIPTDDYLYFNGGSDRYELASMKKVHVTDYPAVYTPMGNYLYGFSHEPGSSGPRILRIDLTTGDAKELWSISLTTGGSSNVSFLSSSSIFLSWLGDGTVDRVVRFVLPPAP
jgi:hypothetical protein